MMPFRPTRTRDWSIVGVDEKKLLRWQKGALQ